MKTKQNLLCIALSLIMLLMLPISSYASSSQELIYRTYSDNKIDKMLAEGFEIQTKIKTDGSIEKTVINPDNSTEVYIIRGNEMYDDKGAKIATFEEEIIMNAYPDYTIQATSHSATSPYPISDYSVYKGMTSGNVILHQSILNISLGALAIIVGVVAPPIGATLSAMLIAAGIKRNINAYAIFYRKWQYHHRYLGSLEKMWETQWYWDPGLTVKAGNIARYYSSFY